MDGEKLAFSCQTLIAIKDNAIAFVLLRGLCITRCLDLTYISLWIQTRIFHILVNFQLCYHVSLDNDVSDIEISTSNRLNSAIVRLFMKPRIMS